MSESMRRHFRSLWGAIQAISPAKSVLEIGSNTGEFLLHCKANSAETILGIEPSDLALIAKSRGVPTFQEKYEACTYTRPTDKPDVIVARHVFAHVDDWKGFVASLEKDAGPNTLIVIEVPYVLDTLNRVELDQKYHEHLSYVSLKAMTALLKDSPFQIAYVMPFEIHGGAVAIFLNRKGNPVDAFSLRTVAEENITLQDWQAFASKARRRIDSLRMVVGCYLGSKKVVGFGASAKSSVWIQSCGFTRNDIAFICDNTPQKQGRLSPGTDIPIVPESELTRDKADVAINFAWQYHDEIVKKHQAWVDAGGRFVNPHLL